jgi:hypothetical protein
MKIDRSFESGDPPKEDRAPGEADARRYKRPTKEEVREWLKTMIASRRPPPAMDEIRRELWRAAGPDDGDKS